MGKQALGRFALVAAAVAALAVACSDRVPAPETPTPTATPAAVRTPVSTPPVEVASPSPWADVARLELGTEAPFPLNTALIIETGCWQCDGPTSGLERVYLRPDGSPSRDKLIDPGLLGLPDYVDSMGVQRAPYIAGFAMTPGLSEIVVGVCVAGTCAVDGLDVWAPDSALAVYRSVDGGVTWTRLGEVQGGLSLEGIIAPGRYLVSRSVVRNEVTHEVFPGGEPVRPPSGSKWAFGVVAGEVLWWTEDSRVLRGDGSTFADFGPETYPARVASDGSTTVLLWHRTKFGGEGTDFVSVISKDSVSTFGLPGLSLSMIPFGEGTLIGNVSYADGRYAPSIIDLERGVIHRIDGPFPAEGVQTDRTQVVGFQTGPLARVVNTGSCLNIREGPSVESAVLTCAADGVLLRIESGEPPAPGWLEVTTPSGTRGYASTQYLER